MPTAGQVLDIVVGTFVEALARSGVRDVCVCPGSRSTPLALKLVDHADIKVWMHLDERSAAYFGLGLAKARRAPVALLATSGTATANFYPAVVEAFLARVPLVVLTADRPHELRDRGAAQTIDQVRLYGEHVKWFFDLPEPEVEHAQLVASFASRAVAEAQADPPGPVHLNWPFREPLIPEPTSASLSISTSVTVSQGRRAPSPELIDRLRDELAQQPRGLIVCGPQDDPELRTAVTALARRLGYPIAADPLSGVRYGMHDRELVLDAYDAFLRHPSLTRDLEPKLVLAIGAMPTSKPLLQYLQGVKLDHYVLIDGGGGWRDPAGLATEVVHCDPRLLCDALSLNAQRTTEWAESWTRLNQATRRAIDTHLQAIDEPFEGGVFPALESLLRDGATLFVGNSMPVRDLDTFLGSSEKTWRVLSNRGTNGIDGVVSSALGASAAAPGHPAVLVIGDLSFYHDMNGLLAAGRFGLDLLVVLINNDGGGIFSFLPQADHAEHFEQLFGTPHSLDFQPFVEGYGGRFVRITHPVELTQALSDGLTRGGLQVVEVPTERRRNVELHRQVWRAVAAALEPVAAR
jgi:2-succinyl-5-enolpyruvyl-6-hydroxy-3-cyclohexene-1-carboxylate synthase